VFEAFVSSQKEGWIELRANYRAKELLWKVIVRLRR